MREYIKCLIGSAYSNKGTYNNNERWREWLSNYNIGDKVIIPGIRMIDDFEGFLLGGVPAERLWEVSPYFKKTRETRIFVKKFFPERNCITNFGKRFFVGSYMLDYRIQLYVERLTKTLSNMINNNFSFDDDFKDAVEESLLDVEEQLKSALLTDLFKENKVDLFLKRLLMHFYDYLSVTSKLTPELLYSCVEFYQITRTFIYACSTNFIFEAEILPENIDTEHFLEYLHETSSVLEKKLLDLKERWYADVDYGGLPGILGRGKEYFDKKKSFIPLITSGLTTKLKKDAKFSQILEQQILSNFIPNSQAKLSQYKGLSPEEKRILEKYLDSLETDKFLDFCLEILKK